MPHTEHPHPLPRRSCGLTRRRSKPVQRMNEYSLMHVAEVPVYWRSGKPASRETSFIALNRAGTRLATRGGEYAHVGPLDPVSRLTTYSSPQEIGRRRTYDSRIDPKIRAARERQTKSIPLQPNPPANSSRTESLTSPNKNSQNWGSTEFWKRLLILWY